MLPLMARLIGPEDLGLYNMALPILTFVILLSDGGLGDSLAREKTSEDLVWSSAFWGLLGAGTVLAGALYVASFPIAAAARQPRLPSVMLPLSATLLMVAATVIPNARMMRSGRVAYGPVGDLIGNLIGAGLGLYLAYSGYGVWAAVWQYIVSFGIRTVTFNVVEPYVPRFAFSLKALVSHSGVGGAIMGGRLVDLATRTIENAHVSRVMGPVALGAYGYANTVPRFVSEAASNPIWANMYYLALNQSPEETRHAYIRNTRMVAMVLFPAAALLAVGLPVIVPYLLGPRWNSAIAPMAILLACYPALAVSSLSGSVLYAKGVARLPFFAFCALAISRVGVVLLVSFIGLTGVAVGLSAVTIVYWAALSFLAARHIGNTVRALLGALAGPFAGTALVAAVAYFILHREATPVGAVIAGAASAVVYLFGLMVFDRKHLRMDMDVVLSVVRRRA